MKNIFTTIYSALMIIGKARAAAHFARQGNIEAAKALMLQP